jgi:DNA-directed RNA polymerase II subunit RPB2
MVRSNFCMLHSLQEDSFYQLGECPYDSGGYFIVKGSEKVLIAQERMAFNNVYTFKKASTSGFSFYSTVTSQVEKTGKISEMEVRLYPKPRDTAATGATIRVKIPKVKVDIPVVIVFRALGIVPDRDVLSHICFDENDTAVLEKLQPSIEEAFSVQDRDAALDFIGRRAQNEMGTRAQRQRAAFDILQMEFLPHVSVSEGFESKKAYFLGFMTHRLISAYLGRRELDDRDHFGNKRLDLAGPLLANLFRQLFYRFTKRIRDELQRVRRALSPLKSSN